MRGSVGEWTEQPFHASGQAAGPSFREESLGGRGFSFPADVPAVETICLVDYFVLPGLGHLLIKSPFYRMLTCRDVFVRRVQRWPWRGSCCHVTPVSQPEAAR